MNSYLNKIIAAFLILGVLSCDSDFAELNTDPNKPDAELFDPNLILPTVVYNYFDFNTGYSGAILFQSMWAQIFASTSTGGANYYSNGDKYVPSGNTNSYQESLWNGLYEAASKAKQMEDLANQKNLPNLAATGKIIQIMCISVISDVYGDVPYAEALQAASGITQPAYQPQEEAYPQMLADLESAVAALNASADDLTNDTVYDGDISQWRKLGYSIMLKMAMRLVENDQATAGAYVQKALAGGVFASAADDAVAYADFTNGYANTNSNALATAADIYEVRWSKTLIDYLQANDDPRLTVIAEIPPAGLSGNNNGAIQGNSDPDDQQGLPNGYDLAGGATDVSTEPNYPGPTGTGDNTAALGNYSRPTGIYRNRNTPWFIITYAETELLQAEAAIRGLGGATNPTGHYRNAVIAAMMTMNKMGGTQITGADMTAYADTHPLNITTNAMALEMINNQLWASVGMWGNFIESWSNWRRSGYPDLEAVNYTGNFSQGTIPLRQLYPTSESTNNTANYQQAVSNMGGSDNWTTPVWWDE